MQISQIETRKTPTLSLLLGLEEDGCVNISDSHMTEICNDIRRILPSLIVVNEDEADVSAAIGVMGRVADVFQRVIDELS